MTAELATIEAPEQHVPALLDPQRQMTYLAKTMEAVEETMRNIMKPDVDYGQVPGTRSKPSLYKPGAEILMRLFQLHHSLVILDQVEDWETPFFRYKVKVVLRDGAGNTIGEGIGEANSKETRYQHRYCPECEGGVWDNRYHQSQGRFTDRPPFTCKSDCGWAGTQKPKDVPTRFDFELVNTLIKMAGKRAKVEAVLTATAASHFFTQDVEDLAPDQRLSSVDAPAQTSGGSPPQQSGSQETQYECPVCDSKVYDNRERNANLKDGEKKWPAFKCSNKECNATDAETGEVVGDGTAGEPWMTWSTSWFDKDTEKEGESGSAGLDSPELKEVQGHVESGTIKESAVLVIARRIAKEKKQKQPTSLSEIGELSKGIQEAVAEAVAVKIAEAD